MKSDPSSDPIPIPLPDPIRIPLSQRWREMRLRWMPLLVFFGAIATIALLWREHVVPTTLVGQAEPVLANVSCHKAGVLTDLGVVRFQKVKAGDTIGRVMVADPQVLAATLGVIRSEIDVLRADFKPLALQQRTAMDYTQLRLDWMKQRAALASAQVNLQLSETEMRRTEELFKSRIATQQKLDEAKAAYQGNLKVTQELGALVAEGEANFKTLQLTNSDEITRASEKPILAAIAVSESKLRLAEAELSPIVLKSPIDGIITVILAHSGEAVVAGQPVVSIATLSPVRIVGYLRSPVVNEPRAGMKVTIRTRGFNRETGAAEVLEVGTQFEAIPEPMLGPIKLASSELGIPVDISLPANLKIRPGELVDIILPPNKRSD